jgi:hypothetical protein
MKLHELKLFEEPIQTRSAEEIWAELGSDASQFITTTVYYVRPLRGDANRYEVLFDDKGKRKPYGVMDEEDLNAAFAPIRPNQRPDAEGFLAYRSADVYDAFKYGGDPVKVTLGASTDGENPGGQTVKLNKGDYLLRQDDGNDFTYTVERANFFDNNYTKKT